jgi:hypothetical protein
MTTYFPGTNIPKPNAAPGQVLVGGARAGSAATGHPMPTTPMYNQSRGINTPSAAPSTPRVPRVKPAVPTSGMAPAKQPILIAPNSPANRAGQKGPNRERVGIINSGV